MNDAAQKFVVKDSQFQGPLDVLLDLIEEKKLDITTISLAAVTADFLKYVENLQIDDKRALAEFLSVLAKLLLIKSRSILPALAVLPEEEEDLKILEWRLKELKKYRDAGKLLAKLFAQNRHSYNREAFSGLEPIFYPPPIISVHDLLQAFQYVFSAIAAARAVWELPKPINLDDKINEVMGRIAKSLSSVSFKSMITKKDREEIIVLFLAILHLARNAGIMIRQEGNFGEITLEKSEDII